MPFAGRLLQDASSMSMEARKRCALRGAKKVVRFLKRRAVLYGNDRCAFHDSTGAHDEPPMKRRAELVVLVALLAALADLLIEVRLGGAIA